MPLTIIDKIANHKKNLATAIVIFLCLLLSITFPASDTFQIISRNVFFLILLPLIYIKLILKENLSTWGWNLNQKKLGLLLSFVYFFSGLAIFFLLIRFAGFSFHYQISAFSKNNFFSFLFYELILLNIFFFTQEVFFKSFVLFSFKQFSAWTVLLQSGIYLLVLMLSKSLSWQITPFIFISLFGGWITYKTKSFFYSYFFGLLFIIILDAYIISLVK